MAVSMALKGLAVRLGTNKMLASALQRAKTDLAHDPTR